jgi:hypothetical protein
MAEDSKKRRANTDKTSPADENASPPIVDEAVGGAIPNAFSTDANVAQKESAPYLHLARTFDLVEQESGKLKTTVILCNMFRRLLALSPEHVLPAIYLCINRIAPDYENVGSEEATKKSIYNVSCE